MFEFKCQEGTNHSTWPDHMTGLVGWWRRVERDGEREGNEMMKQTRLLEERAGKQACKLSFIQKFFPDSNLSPGGSGRLRGRRVTTSHRQPVENLKCEPKFSIVIPEKELSPAADCYQK